MEAEERPSKFQKLRHQPSGPPGSDTTPITMPSDVDHKTTQTTQQTQNDDPEISLKSEDGEPFRKARSPLPEGLSRSAYKKQKRQQEWDAGKAARRAKKKDKEKAKKQEKRAERQAAIANGELPKDAPLHPKQIAKVPAIQVPVTFIIDCEFDGLMCAAEIKSLASQITRCYSDNSRSLFKAHLAVSSFGERLKDRFDNVLEKQYESWKGIRFFPEDFVEVSQKAKDWMRDPEKGGTLAGTLSPVENNGEDINSHQSEGEVIYLSAESDNTITELKPYSTYIVGGLVDRNRHKGICYKRATERGVKTAKLPIGDFLQMSSRFVLTTNHVNEIMLKWLELGDWGEALMKVIPKRKGGELKSAAAGGVSTEGETKEGKDSITSESDNEPDDDVDTHHSGPAGAETAGMQGEC